MNKIRPTTTATIVLFLFVWAGIISGLQAQTTKHVIMISVDGMPPDYYTAPEKLGLRVPTLDLLKRGGAYAEGVEGVYPTVTYPQHTTLVTGVRPAVHGIVQNRIFEAPTDPQTRAWYWYANALKTETLWTKAKKAGMTIGAVGWPVTIGSEIDYNVPEIYEPGESPATWKLIAQHSTPGILEKALGADLSKDKNTDERLTMVSEHIIKAHKPNLLLIHLIELDSVHHRNGPRTKPAIEMAEREDGYIKRIIEATRQAGIYEQTTFLIVSDHGFAKISQRFEPNVVLAKEQLITLDASGKPTAWKAAAWPAGGSCAIVLRDPNDKETAAKVKSIFSQIARRDNSPIKQISTPDQLRKMKAIPQAALMLEANEGFSFNDALTGPEIHESGETYQGTHGYLPTNPAMRASLILYGTGVRKGVQVPFVRMVDIAPSIAALLKIDLPNTEGKPLKTLLLAK